MRTTYLILVMLMMGVACTQKVDQTIHIYPDQIISTDYIGNGVQWSAYPHADTENAEWGKLMTNAKWEMNFKRLDYMKPKLFRVLDQANWRYLVGFNEEGEPIVDYTTPEVKALERILEYAQKNNITVLFGEWGTPYKVHDVGEGHGDQFFGANDPKWIDIIVNYLDYLIVDKGYTCIKYYNLVNEPNGDWATTKGDFNEWRDGIKLLSEAIKNKGLDRYVQVAGPDAVSRYDNPESIYTGMGWVEETAKQLSEHLGIYEVHDYTSHELIKTGNFKHFHKQAADIAKNDNKQIIFGEIGITKANKENQDRVNADPFASKDSQMEVYDFSYGINMADAAIQSMNAGYSGAAAWALDDAMHTLDDLGDRNQLKRWGMWNSLGTELCSNPDDENLRPWFYTWSLMCRYFPAGSKIIETDSSGIEGLRLTAAMHNEDLSIAIVNNSAQDNILELSIPSEKKMKRFLYLENNSKVDEDGFPTVVDFINPKNKIVKLKMQSNSFVLLTSINN